MNEKQERINTLRDMLNIQGSDGCWNYDSYMLGMYNGMELALAVLEDREPQYRTTPENGWIVDIKKEL